MYPVLIYKCVECGEKFEYAEFQKSKFMQKYCIFCGSYTIHKMIDNRLEDGTPPIKSKNYLFDEMEDEPSCQEIKKELSELHKKGDKTSSEISLDEVDYLCKDCALDHGGSWPKGHIATAHEGKCAVCSEVKTLTNVGDWNWPDGEKRGMRD